MNRKIDWQQFFISVLGTAIGVALTFVVSGMLERRNKAQAQRLTAIMVIHDIDNTIDILKLWKQQETQNDKVLHRILDNKDLVDTMPPDSLYGALGLLVDSYSDFNFDTSKEQIFNSDLDTWQNLGNMKFIDNVQSFFHGRHDVQDGVNQSTMWQEPIPDEEYMQLIMRVGIESADDYTAAIRHFLKEKLSENLVSYYINVSPHRVSYLNDLIDYWTTLNNENKFLMGITDQELEDYINNINKKGSPLSKSRLLGKWLITTEDGTIEYDFKADKSYIFTNHRSSFIRDKYWWGKLKISFSYDGTWALQGDSIILFPSYNTSDVELDTGELVIENSMQDSLNNWLTGHRERTLDFFKELASQEERVAYGARLDSSKDKMEWVSPEGKTRYPVRYRPQ